METQNFFFVVTRQKTSFFISLPSSNLNHLSYSISIEVADPAVRAHRQITVKSPTHW